MLNMTLRDLLHCVYNICNLCIKALLVGWNSRVGRRCTVLGKDAGWAVVSAVPAVVELLRLRMHLFLMNCINIGTVYVVFLVFIYICTLFVSYSRWRIISCSSSNGNISLSRSFQNSPRWVMDQPWGFRVTVNWVAHGLGAEWLGFLTGNE